MAILLHLLWLPLICQAQDIGIINLDETPGLVAFSMGKAKLHDYYKTSIYYYDLDMIHEVLNKLSVQVDSLVIANQTEHKKIKEKLKNAYMRFENLINPEGKQKRAVGGFFTGLKSSLKAFNWKGAAENLNLGLEITKNGYDLYEAFSGKDNKYNDAMSQMQQSSKHEIDMLNEKVSIFKQKTQEFDNKIKCLEDAQKKVSEKIDALKKNVQKLEFNLEMVIIYNDFHYQIDSIKEILQDLENAVTFAKLGIVHPAIIRPLDLYNLIDEEFGNFNKDKLLYSVSRKNIRKFYDMVQVRSYTETNKIVFLLSLPIVKETVYDLYYLNSVPVKREDTYHTIQPPKSFVLVDDRSNFMFSDEGCEILGSTYYCKGFMDFGSDDQVKCISQIINHENNFSTCKFTDVEISDTMVQHVTDQFYLAVVPHFEQIKTRCSVGNIKLITGTVLITLPQSCSFELSTAMFMNNGASGGIQPIIPQKISWDQIKSGPSKQRRRNPVDFSTEKPGRLKSGHNESALSTSFCPKVNVWTFMVLFITRVLFM